MLVVKDIMTRRIDEVALGHALGEVAALMARSRVSSVIVAEDNRLAGIVTERDVLHAMLAGKAPTTPVAAVMSAPVITVPSQLDCREAYQLARRSGVRHLAVAEPDGIPIGIVTETDFRYHLQLMQAADKHDIASAMDMPLWTLEPQADLAEALALMENRHATCIVVAAARQPLGILTEHDVVRLYAHDTAGATLAEVMTSPVVTVAAGTPLRAAAERMLEHRIRHLVVVDGAGLLVGLLTERGLMRPLELGIAEEVWREREKAAVELLDKDAQIATLIEALPDAVCFKDGAGRWQLANAAGLGILGLTSLPWRGKSEDELARLNPAFAAAHLVSQNSDERAWQAGKLTHSSEVIDGADGELRHFDVTKVPLFHADGRRKGLVTVGRDVTLLREHQKRLEHLAHYDALTQLPNRVLLADRLQLAIAQAQRSGRLLAVCYLDLDDFKPINDALGHEAGDRLLVEVAQRLKGCMRSGDTVSRFGGDEFALLLAGIENVDECERAIARIFAALAAPFSLKGGGVSVSAGIGVTLYPHDNANPDTLLRHADQAMYLAKQAGRNRYHLYDAEHDRRARARREAFERIETAHRQQEFRLYFQPKVDIRRGKVIGAEALIRWQHPERGLVAPAEFLPVIEDSDFSLTLGDWVIGEALRQMEVWARQGIDLHVSVNISARQLQQEDFAERLAAQLAAHPGVQPRRLELEIVETAALEDINRVNAVIAACHALGVSFALDDFGTGYSSLTYLKRLPARILKIDQSFVRDMLDDPEDLAIVEGVIGLTQAFRREVIAEGVETAQHGRLLMQLGCDQVQGFGIAHPMPGDDIPAWIQNYKPDPVWTDALHLPREDLPLLALEIDHNRWIDRLAALLQAGTDAAQPAFDHAECGFGRWYGGVGRERYGGLDSFRELAPLHDEVHRTGRELLRLHQAGRRQDAQRQLDDLYAQRDRLFDQLRAVRIDASLTGAERM